MFSLSLVNLFNCCLSSVSVSYSRMSDDGTVSQHPRPCQLFLIPHTARINKDTFLHLHVMNAYAGSWGIGPIILSRGATWRWVVNITLRPTYPRYPVNRKVYERQSRSENYGEENNVFYTPGFEPRFVRSAAWSHCLLHYLFPIYIRKWRTLEWTNNHMRYISETKMMTA